MPNQVGLYCIVSGELWEQVAKLAEEAEATPIIYLAECVEISVIERGGHGAILEHTEEASER